jgi:hypothetical protein
MYFAEVNEPGSSACNYRASAISLSWFFVLENFQEMQAAPVISCAFVRCSHPCLLTWGNPSWYTTRMPTRNFQDIAARIKSLWEDSGAKEKKLHLRWCHHCLTIMLHGAEAGDITGMYWLVLCPTAPMSSSLASAMLPINRFVVFFFWRWLYFVCQRENVAWWIMCNIVTILDRIWCTIVHLPSSCSLCTRWFALYKDTPTHIHTHTHGPCMCACACARVRVGVCVCARVCMFVCMCVYVCVLVNDSHVFVHIFYVYATHMFKYKITHYTCT